MIGEDREGWEIEETEACADRLRNTLAAIDEAGPVAPPGLLDKLAQLSRLLGQALGEELLPPLEVALARLDEMAALIGEAQEDATRLIDDLQAEGERT